MSVSLDRFFSRTKTIDYKCMDFAAEVWHEITGEDLHIRCAKYFEQKRINLDEAHTFTILPTPISPCLVLMQNSPTSELHMGVYYEGNLIHLTSEGVTNRGLWAVANQYKHLKFIR